MGCTSNGRKSRVGISFRFARPPLPRLDVKLLDSPHHLLSASPVIYPWNASSPYHHARSNQLRGVPESWLRLVRRWTCVRHTRRSPYGEEPYSKICTKVWISARSPVATKCLLSPSLFAHTSQGSFTSLCTDQRSVLESVLDFVVWYAHVHGYFGACSWRLAYKLSSYSVNTILPPHWIITAAWDIGVQFDYYAKQKILIWHDVIIIISRWSIEQEWLKHELSSCIRYSLLEIGCDYI